MDAVVRRRALIVVIPLTLVVAVLFFLLKPFGQDLRYHSFCDTRTIFGIPNFFDVISNLPFAIAGGWAFTLLKRGEWIFAVVFAGIFLTGIGSAWYHLAPDNASLVWDRLPMTVIFMGVLAWVLGEIFGRHISLILIGPLVALGIFSIYWWNYTESRGAGDLRLYVLVQYYSIFLILLLLILVGGHRRQLRLLSLALVWYLAAKAFDRLDCQVFSATGLVGGHTIKHLLAAISTLYIVKIYQSKTIYSTGTESVSQTPLSDR